MQLNMNQIPSRIVSLVPSLTELLFDLGLEEEVVGITKFCIHPNQWFRQKTRVGGTKQLHIDKIISLQPDLIIANKEENVKEQIDILAQKFPVWVTDINNIDEALITIKELGIKIGKEEEALQMADKITQQFQSYCPNPTKRALYFIWQKPYMVAGVDTFISAMMKLAGYENIMQDIRYPTLSEESIAALKPPYILLSSEPFPFKEKHLLEFRLMFPDSIIKLVDGEIFSWYGSRMLKAIDYFRSLNEDI